jgi:glycosyltransferase involved in cell wall biosynthesis
MGVFNAIEYDGRVQRAADALATVYEVTVCCTGTGPAPDGARYAVVRSGAGGRIQAHIRFWRSFLSTARALRPDIVYAHDFFLPAAGYIAARLTRATFIYDAHELDIPEPGVPFSLRSRLFYTAERCTIRKADAVIAANPERATIMRQVFKLRQTPTVVRNIPPLSPSRYSLDDLRAKYPMLARPNRQTIRILYQGDINYQRGVQSFMEALRLLPDTYQLVIVGGGPDQGDVAEAIQYERYGKNRLIWIGKVPRADLFDMMRLCDIGIVTYRMASQNHLLCAPNKIYEYAQAGLPVVATAQPTLKSIIEQNPIGVLVKDEGHEFPTPESTAQAIIMVAQNLQYHQQALPRFVAENSWEQQAAMLLRTVASVTERASTI